MVDRLAGVWTNKMNQRHSNIDVKQAVAASEQRVRWLLNSMLGRSMRAIRCRLVGL